MSVKNEYKNGVRDFPRPGSSLYNLLHDNEKIKEKTLKKYKKINKYLILPLYRIRLLPLLSLGRIFLVLTTKGRKSGKMRKTPLEYHRMDGVITVVSGRGEEADWLKNVRADPNAIWVRHGFHHFQPRVEIIIDESKKLKFVRWFVKKHKRVAKMLFGWNSKLDDPETADFSTLLKSVVIIQLHRKPE